MEAARKTPRQYIRFPHFVSADRHQDPVLNGPAHFQKKRQGVYLPRLDVVIRDNPQPRSENAPSVHNICWKALADQPSIDLLRHLGLAMTPLVWTGLPQSIHQLALPGTIEPLSLEVDRRDGGNTALSELLERCGRLPAELIAMIWDLIPPCTVRCLLALSSAKSIWSTLPLVATGRKFAAFAKGTRSMGMKAPLLSAYRFPSLSWPSSLYLELSGFEGSVFSLKAKPIPGA
ncbi:hypothetical protein P170DRAFT_422579 [Aspergillus steynii IBT 23096]|uniref:Uncharacterized protein n=1 Tax=Aspergillus steynii IBT 23096 TaxID=1392250 RepID=A0A2I2GFG9_9EURO|nr:uncharacterized protein P170DRAFT_422579 [Aspergillus steynii IBT 23096]PLB51577.1 hypothetical protein P170DRAFT_422579 [Aspergillus steynii IBT 23096]